MIPLFSDRRLSSFPFVTIALIAANLTVFWFQLTGEGSVAASVYRYGLIPALLFGRGSSAAPGIAVAVPPELAVLTSIFLHGGVLHLVMNMLYLWVFGRDVEDDFGHIRFLAFYLMAGILAALAFAYTFPQTTIPLVGASGAIAGVLGVYFLRFPTARVRCLLIIIIIVKMIDIPAFVLLGIWFFIQIGASMTSIAGSGGTGAAGVAWISHVTGFVVGILWTLILLRHRYHERRG